jgi:hypothetical protein
MDHKESPGYGAGAVYCNAANGSTNMHFEGIRGKIVNQIVDCDGVDGIPH